MPDMPISPAEIAGQYVFRTPGRLVFKERFKERPFLQVEHACRQPPRLRRYKPCWRYRPSMQHQSTLTLNQLRLRRRLHSSAQQRAQRPMQALRLARKLHSILLDA